jgi:hypothetical protein
VTVWRFGYQTLSARTAPMGAGHVCLHRGLICRSLDLS